MRVTADSITELKNGEVFVFGSNTAGLHGKGAARVALRLGAVYGYGAGRHGNTYAIPTKDHRINTLPLEQIRGYVHDFVRYASEHPKRIFLVTEIGCGLAGYSPEQIAPMFADCVKMENVHLPERFWDKLK